uniref:Titin n=1 Tax=Astyanax mexicanus TaxID=7994 RepID=A0A8B9H2Y0_ASTMX
MAVNKYGVGEALESDPTIADNPYVPPDPPQTPEITAVTKDSIVVCWGAPAHNGGSEITNYGIERRDRLSLRWVKCNKKKVTDLHFKVTGLVPGHEYEFRVFAENAAGISAPSGSSPFTKASDALFKPGPPGNPRILDTTSSSITLAWNRPLYDGGSEVTGYIVETCLPGTEEEEWKIVTPKEGLKGTSFTITNLKENQEYKINVSAMNSEGVGEAAAVPGTPKAEERLIAPEIDLDADLRKIVNIRACNTLRLFVPIRGRPTPEVKWARENDEPLDRATIENTSSFTSLVIGNVNRFDSGKYNLTVENSSGSKTVSVTVRVLDTPGAPQNLKISQVTKESVTLIWEPPINDGGTKIKNYVVEKREATRKAYATVNALCHKTTWTIDQLQEGCNYYFRVLAENEYGIGLPIETGESVKVSEKPLPPRKVILQDVTKTSVTLSWEKPEHDGGSRVVAYVVEIQPKGSDKWSQSVIVKVPEAVISGLNTGEEYMFRVSARNEKGTSDPRQIGVPVIVKDLVIAPSAKLLFSTYTVLAEKDLTIDIPYIARPKAAVSWVKDGAPLKRTSRVNFSSTDTLLSLVIKEATRDDAKLADGGLYTLLLKNPGGEKGVQVNICVLDKPGAPEGPVTITGVTCDQCCLSWKAPKQDGGSKITHYIVERRETSRLIWTLVEPKVPIEYLKVTKLLEGNEYIFRVMPVNKFGVGEALQSDPVVIKDPFTLPDAPKAVEVSNVKKDSMVLTWEAPTSDGGTPITGYVIEKHDKEGVRWTRCNRQTVTDLTFKVTGLLEGHLYEFRVAAENGVGVGEPSSATVYYKALDPVFKPGPPNNPKVTDTTKSSVSLAWGKPMHDGGCEIQGYIVEFSPADEWAMCTPPSGVKLTRFIVENLKEKQEYKFRVCAINKVGVGEPADLPDPILPEDKAEEPDLDIDPEFRKLAIIKAGRPLRVFIPIRGRPVPQIKWEKDECPLKETVQVEVTSSHTSLVIDKVSRVDSGKYTVFAENSAGVKSATISVKVLDTPSAPVNLKVVEITKENVTLSWEPPALDGGAKIKNYIVEKRETTRKTFSAVVTNCHKLSWKIEPLQEGCSYYFRVLAENEHGIGLPADITESIKVSEVPQCPGKLSIVDVTKKSVSLAWEKPVHDGGSRIIQYLVEVQVKGQDKWSVCANVKTLEAVVSNLNPGEEYIFRVIAINEKGKSDPRALAVPVQTKDLVIEPDVRPAFSNYSVLVGKDLQVEIPVSGRPKPKVAWTKDGAALKFTTRVNINNTPTSTILSIKEAAREDGGMYGINVSNSAGQKDATIEIITLDKVYAENIVGIGRCSKLSEGYVARDPCDPPGTPEAVHVSKSSITIQWTKPEYDGGSSITGYNVEKRDLPEGRWTKASFTNIIETQFTITGLTEGAKYDFRVIAKNAVGTISKPSYNSGPIAAL